MTTSSQIILATIGGLGGLASLTYAAYYRGKISVLKSSDTVQMDEIKSFQSGYNQFEAVQGLVNAGKEDLNEDNTK